MLSDPSRPFNVSVVIPLKNEEGNIAILIDEIERALTENTPYQIIAVNDGSTDHTKKILKALAEMKPWLIVVEHAHSCGQSVALRSGVRKASAPVIATMDGDGQNNPAFLPAMIAKLNDPKVGLVQGERQGRKDTGFKRFQSRIANRVRRFILNDKTRDTGCGLKVFRRELYWQLPFFSALHRFMPALVRREGFEIATFPVIDRQRLSGKSNYGFFDRLWVGIVDLFGVWWLLRRYKRRPHIVE